MVPVRGRQQVRVGTRCDKSLEEAVLSEALPASGPHALTGSGVTRPALLQAKGLLTRAGVYTACGHHSETWHCARLAAIQTL